MAVEFGGLVAMDEVVTVEVAVDAGADVGVDGVNVVDFAGVVDFVGVVDAVTVVADVGMAETVVENAIDVVVVAVAVDGAGAVAAVEVAMGGKTVDAFRAVLARMRESAWT